jgi:hypothetical protein
MFVTTSTTPLRNKSLHSGNGAYLQSHFSGYTVTEEVK